ncbi:MAG: TolC family protein [Alphaproteobacteria bacterium]|nr:TolC family protein [Alphaproteobacteria bacterium]MDE2630186.1 TolC family protein [Alphaproteobacteria bacterium]
MRTFLLTPAVALWLLLLSFAAAGAAPAEQPAKALLYPDPFVEQVLQRNAMIRAREAGHDAAVARITSAGALDDPMVSYVSAPETFGTMMGYRQNIQVSQRIPWPGTLTLRSEAARADADSAEYKVADIRLKLAAQARATYADWYYVHRAIAINKATITIVERLKSVAAAAYASGQAPEQDVLQAEVELTRLQNQSLELEQRRRAVQAQINNLLNADPDSLVGAPDALPTPPFLMAYAELEAAALAQYPALKSLDATVAANRERVEVARKGFYPNITLMAGENTLMSPASMQPSVGIAINIPISGMHEGELDMAHANLRQSESELIAAQSQLLSDLDATCAGVQQARDTIDLYDKRLVPLAGLNLKAAESDYRTGAGDFLKLITAEQQDLMVELEQERARADLYTRLAALDYETGGAVFTNLESKP